MAQTTVGQIRVAMITGEVSKLSPDGTTTALANGDVITESDTVTTGKSSGVVLVFMNGSSVKLGSDTRLAVDEFKMDPLYDVLTNVSALTAEPTQSKTSLNLSYGEMVGDVRKLNASSTYSIKNPVGAAGIRGTGAIYRIAFLPHPNGNSTLTISTTEGVVFVALATPYNNNPIEAGKELVVEIDKAKPGNPVIRIQDLPAGWRP